MCGICLAVGGTPDLLGRSELLADYIKHGADQGSVEVFMLVIHIKIWQVCITEFWLLTL